MNKKAIAFIPLMALFVILLALGMVVIKTTSEPISNSENWIGLTQDTIHEGYADVEYYKFIINSAIEQAVRNSLYKMGNNGGIIDCNKKSGEFILWSDCLPQDFNNNFLTYFESNLKKELGDNYPNYEFKIINTNPLTIEGIAEDKVELTPKLYKGHLNYKYLVDVVYLVDPSFVYKSDYNLAQYKDIKIKIDNEFNCFREKENPNECVPEWNMEKNDDIIEFNIKGPEMIVYKNNKYVLKTINIRFAYDFSKSLLSPKGSLI